jgi:(1->4)-alpha-D-glucan 1-alpha-D-glucosylmutase
VLRATYRVQLTPAFGFDALRGTVPYLRRLGISHLYLSPVFRSRPGSNHGYDVTDPARLNPELGDRAGFDALAGACRMHDLGLVLDIVPNHMAVGADNAWWFDVLENGPASRFAAWFDIDWAPVRTSMRNRLLVPVLAAPLGEVIDGGGIRIVFRPETGVLLVRHAEADFPLEPRTYPLVLRATGSAPDAAAIAHAAAREELASLLDAFAALPPPLAAPPEVLHTRDRDREVNQRRLARLCASEPAVRAYIDSALQRINAPAPELLAELLQAQPYRLAFWRVSGEEVNYRRFFDVNDFAALRMEEPEVFAATHVLVRELWQAGAIDGVRVDHADGLYDPAAYFRRLRELLAAEPPRQQAWVVAEKILEPGEKLPGDWYVDGTTGYEFGALVTGWLVHAPGIDALERIYRRFVGRTRPYAEIVYRSKQQVMRTSLAAQISMLAARLDRLAQLHRNTSDFTLFDLREAIVEVLACFPVYRTYLAPGRSSAEDAQHVRRAMGAASSRKQATRRALEFLERVLLGEPPMEPSRADAASVFTQKFQQVCGAVMAKGVEDTAFYRHTAFLAMNEVGAGPDARGVSTEALHRANEARARDWPRSMLSTSTHDSKRGEDVRLRLCVLSEMPQPWAACVGRWRRLKRRRQDAGVPASLEYLLLQSLLGIWPADGAADVASLRERLGEHAVKAAREAKEATSWLDPDAAVEDSLRDLVDRMLPASRAAGFERYFRDVIEHAAFFGMLNALAAVVLKMTAPGIPDIYQGNELPALVLVDPDNRRPLDVGACSAALASIEQLLARESPAVVATRLLEGWRDGRLKLFATLLLLRLRGTHASAFAGDYVPLQAEGACAQHLCAFARVAADATIVVVVSRWSAILTQGALQAPLGREVWRDTVVRAPRNVPSGRYVDVLAGHEHDASSRGDDAAFEAGALLATLPCCVLVSQERT